MTYFCFAALMFINNFKYLCKFYFKSCNYFKFGIEICIRFKAATCSVSLGRIIFWNVKQPQRFSNRRQGKRQRWAKGNVSAVWQPQLVDWWGEGRECNEGNEMATMATGVACQLHEKPTELCPPGSCHLSKGKWCQVNQRATIFFSLSSFLYFAMRFFSLWNAEIFTPATAAKLSIETVNKVYKNKSGGEKETKKAS